jgi:hypothetical protein
MFLIFTEKDIVKKQITETELSSLLKFIAGILIKRTVFKSHS